MSAAPAGGRSSTSRSARRRRPRPCPAAEAGRKGGGLPKTGIWRTASPEQDRGDASGSKCNPRESTGIRIARGLPPGRSWGRPPRPEDVTLSEGLRETWIASPRHASVTEVPQAARRGRPPRSASTSSGSDGLENPRRPRAQTGSRPSRGTGLPVAVRACAALPSHTLQAWNAGWTRPRLPPARWGVSPGRCALIADRADRAGTPRRRSIPPGERPRWREP